VTGTTATPHEVALLRVVGQRLAGPPLAGAADVVELLGAAQGQDYPGVLTSVALRTRARSRAAVEEALDTGAVVRSWPMRGTLHLAPAADLGWMLELAAPGLLVRTARRRAALGLDDVAIARAREVAVGLLEGGRRAVRAELLAAWQEAGLAPAGGRGYHLLFNLALSGVVCFGPVRGAEQEIVLLAEWAPAPRRLAREEALAEWAFRFFRSHGPATVKDLTRWTGLPAADTRLGARLARDRLASLQVDGVEHLLDPATPDLLAEHRADARDALLLPGFDELILGYADRSPTLDRDHEGLVVPGGNGVFAPTIVWDGRVVGTWRLVGRGARRTFTPTLFAAVPPKASRAIEVAAGSLP
jgi:hypothetical protein